MKAAQEQQNKKFNPPQLVHINKISEPEKSIRFSINEAELLELQVNITQNGLLQPILLQDKNGNGTYQIIAGHRRFLACRNLGHKQIQATITIADDASLAIMRASENLSRVNLSPVEEGEIYKELSRAHEMSYAEISTKFGKSKAVIIDRIQLLKLPRFLLDAIHEKKVTHSVAKEFLQFEDLQTQQYFFDHVMETGVNVKTIRQWVIDYKKDKQTSNNPLNDVDPPTTSLVETPVSYFQCDGCQQPEEYGKETCLRLCRKCMKPEQKTEGN